MAERQYSLNGVVRPVCFAGVMVVAAAILGGCSLLPDRGDDYTRAEEGRQLKGLDGEPLPRQRQALPVREVGGSGRTLGDEVPEPPDLTSEILDENYIVESVDDQSWLLVNEVPGRVWPAVSAWMTESGLSVATDSTQLGILQSELTNFSRRARNLVGLDEATDDEPRILVQARLAPGVRRKTTEIQLRPRAVNESARNLVTWQDEPMDQELEEKLLESLSDFLQEREDNRSYSRAALSMSSDPKVTMENADADQHRAIVIDLPLNRVWGEIRRVLEDEGIPVLDLDQSAGYFLVDGRPAEDRKRSWLTRWIAGNEVKPKVTNRLQLTEEGNQVRITADQADDYSGSDYSRPLLTRLYDYLY